MDEGAETVRGHPRTEPHHIDDQKKALTENRGQDGQDDGLPDHKTLSMMHEDLREILIKQLGNTDNRRFEGSLFMLMNDRYCITLDFIFRMNVLINLQTF